MKWSHSLTWSHLQLHQELGLTWNPSKRRTIGSSTRFARKIARLYSVRNDGVFKMQNQAAIQELSHRAILNVTFSPFGDMVAAATESNSILLFDPLCHKLVHHIPNAHSNSVNCCEFIDNHLFASASDDATVNLWDRRNMNTQIAVLSRYQSAVKNLQYDRESRSLIVTTTDSDGSVYLCPLFTTATHQQDAQDKTLQLSCVTRCRLNVDASKLIFATSEGYMMVIHDLNVSTLATDLAGFRPDLYRLMQCGNSCGFDFGSWYNHLFRSPRNRIELISDFAPENDAHVITSLDVHPKTSAILTRNVSRGDNSEWTCVHSIQDHLRPHKSKPIQQPKDATVHSYSNPHLREDAIGNENDYESTRRANSHDWQSPERFTSSPPHSSSNSSYFSAIQMNTVVIISSRSPDQRAQATILTPNCAYRPIDLSKGLARIYTNLPRLLYHMPEEREHNLPRRHLKECAFSKDGRLICSPHKNGFRLLSFDQEVNEMVMPSKLHPTSPKQLIRVTHLTPHQDTVLLSKFSPTHHLIASACQSGRVAFSHPSLG